MDLEEIKDYTRSSLFYNLVMESPILSGNMQSMISMGYGNDGYEVIIEAPFYDFKKWEKEGVIVHTGESFNGKTDYAYDVNEFGAFGRHNKSEHWVNRVINVICHDVAVKFNGVVEGELPA